MQISYLPPPPSFDPPEYCHPESAEDPVESVVDDEELEGGAGGPPQRDGQRQHQQLRRQRHRVQRVHRVLEEHQPEMNKNLLIRANVTN